MKKDAALVGKIITRAFLDDTDFREQIRPCKILLSQACSKSKDALIKFRISDSFNSHMVQSYHAAKTRKLVSYEIEKRFPKVPQILWDITHSFDYQIVFGLNSSRLLLNRRTAQESFGKEFSESWKCAFDNCFPGITQTRDALAHDEDRILGYTKKGRVSGSLLDAQNLANFGMKIICTDENLNRFEFDFEIDRYTTLLAQLKTLLENFSVSAEKIPANL